MYISGMKTLLKKIFGKKEVTKEDKVVNLIVKLIKDNYKITEYYNPKESDARTYHMVGLWPPTVFYYKDKKLTYNRKLAQDIHDFISDGRLLQPDSELMGEVFEKLYERKVRSTEGYHFNGIIE